MGGLVLAGPGMYGVVGLNFLQFVIRKGIILSSGYVAAGTAFMGFGTGGLMLAIAGPAYRKLVPAVCMIAAKRLELSPHEPQPAGKS